MPDHSERTTSTSSSAAGMETPDNWPSCAVGPEPDLPLPEKRRPVEVKPVPTSAAGPWCPVCRQQTPARGVYQPPNGFYEVFADHGCDGDGRKVQDADHGFLIDGKVVPQWET